MPDNSNDTTQQIPTPPFTPYDKKEYPKESFPSETSDDTNITQAPIYEEPTNTSISEQPLEETSTITPSPVYEALYGTGKNTTTVEGIESLVKKPESNVTENPPPEVGTTTETIAPTIDEKYSKPPMNALGEIPGEQEIANRPGANDLTIEAEKKEQEATEGFRKEKISSITH